MKDLVRMVAIGVGLLAALLGIVLFLGKQTAPPPKPAPPAPVFVPETPTVQIELDLIPRGAKVVLAGAPIQGNVVTVPRGLKPLSLEVSADGYERKTIEIVPDRVKGYHIELDPLGGHMGEHAH